VVLFSPLAGKLLKIKFDGLSVNPGLSSRNHIPTLKDLVSNPLLLLVAGGIISGLLIPYITNQWQNHQKELEIKTDLVGRISESFTALLVVRENMEIDLEDNRIPNNKANVFKNQFRD
jgi:hypothetical protein